MVKRSRGGSRGKGKKGKNWLTSGLVTKGLIMSVVGGLAVGALLPKVGITNKMILAGAGLAVGGAVGGASAFLADKVTGAIGMTSQSSASDPYY